MTTLSIAINSNFILKENESKDLVEFLKNNSYYYDLSNLEVNYVNEISFKNYGRISINGRVIFAVNDVTEIFDYIKTTYNK